MKIIKIEVESCEGCLNHSTYDDYPEEDIDYCMQGVKGKNIDDIKTIPEWCPLPDAISHQDRLRIGITVNHSFDSRENDISNVVGPRYFKRREKERAEEKAAAMKIKDEELNKLVGLVGKTHTAKLVEGK